MSLPTLSLCKVSVTVQEVHTTTTVDRRNTHSEPSALPASSVTQGEQEGQFILSFKADAENVLATEAEELMQLVAYPAVLTGMTVSLNWVAFHGEVFFALDIVPGSLRNSHHKLCLRA